MSTLWTVNIIAVFLLSAILAGVIIPQILLIAYRKKLFDEPDERKIHHIAVPRLGGFAFKPVIFLSVALLLGFNFVFGHTNMLYGIENEVGSLLFLFCTMTILYIVGMADDLVGVRYRAKFVVQIICACLLIAGGTWFDDLHGMFGIHELSPWVGYPLTVLVIVFIINAINLIDGIDGLASGLCSCALLVYGFAFFKLEQYIYSMLSFATLGVLIPFFYYNVFGKAEVHKKIFMGDTGSLTIGMMLCFLSIKLMFCMEENPIAINPMVLAFVPLIIPCFDVIRVYFVRIFNKKNPFLPDKKHIHHKLLALGIKHRNVMIIIIIVSAVTVLCNIQLSKIMNVTLLLIADFAIWILANIWLNKRIEKGNNQNI